MRITYCTNVRLPSERAHGNQVAHVCRALHALGHDVQVVSPYRKESEGKTMQSFYGLPPDIAHDRIGTIDPLSWTWLPQFFGFRIMDYRFRSALRTHLKTVETDMLYTRSPALLSVLLDSTRPVLLELHTIPRGHGFIALANRCTLVVALTTPLRDELIRRGIEASRVIVAGDAVDLTTFGVLPDRKAARMKWNIPGDAFVVGYAGQLQSMGLSKGIPELLGALELSPDVRGLIAGGPASARMLFESALTPEVRTRITFTGPLPHVEVASVLAAADVLVYPAPKSDHPFYMRDTSPLKIFEYMATGIPIVSADLPPVRDILDPSVALLVPPGDSKALSDAIREIKKNPEDARKRADAAKKRVAGHTWDARMARILDAFQERLNSAR